MGRNKGAHRAQAKKRRNATSKEVEQLEAAIKETAPLPGVRLMFKELRTRSDRLLSRQTLSFKTRRALKEMKAVSEESSVITRSVSSRLMASPKASSLR